MRQFFVFLQGCLFIRSFSCYQFFTFPSSYDLLIRRASWFLVQWFFRGLLSWRTRSCLQSAASSFLCPSLTLRCTYSSYLCGLGRSLRQGESASWRLRVVLICWIVVLFQSLLWYSFVCSWPWVPWSASPSSWSTLPAVLSPWGHEVAGTPSFSSRQTALVTRCWKHWSGTVCWFLPPIWEYLLDGMPTGAPWPRRSS